MKNEVNSFIFFVMAEYELDQSTNCPSENQKDLKIKVFKNYISFITVD